MNDKRVIVIVGACGASARTERLIEVLKSENVHVAVYNEEQYAELITTKEKFRALVDELGGISKARFIELCNSLANAGMIEKLLEAERLSLNQSKGPYKSDRDHWKARGRK